MSDGGGLIGTPSVKQTHNNGAFTKNKATLRLEHAQS